MKEVFEKIIERLEEEKRTSYIHAYTHGIEDAIEIVNQVAEEFGSDINVRSNDGWIPVSERLPEEKTWYQCTCSDKRIWSKPIVRDLYYYPSKKSFIDNIRYEASGFKDIENYNWTKYVTAWQPLPQAYQPKGE